VIDHFDMMPRLSRRAPLVCAFALHSFVPGPPFRLRHREGARRPMAAHHDDPRLWLPKPGAIAGHAMSLPVGVIPSGAAA
jgi:hypothetical protein